MTQPSSSDMMWTRSSSSSTTSRRCEKDMYWAALSEKGMPVFEKPLRGPHSERNRVQRRGRLRLISTTLILKEPHFAPGCFSRGAGKRQVSLLPFDQGIPSPSVLRSFGFEWQGTYQQYLAAKELKKLSWRRGPELARATLEFWTMMR